MEFKEKFDALLEEYKADYNICGVISTAQKVYPIGSDTKVLSTVFELFSRPIIQQFADENGYDVIEPTVQNHYPDFTLQKSDNDKRKIAIDVKTTYRNKSNGRFKYTLGGYTSFLRNNTKNIVFPFDEYKEHWVMGFVYTRVALKKAAEYKIYNTDEMEDIALPYKDVKTFFQQKWKISGDKAGSGNTTNIGSISGCIEDFCMGNGPFLSEDEFIDYWRHYERTAKLRAGKYFDIESYRNWKNRR
ncbi:type II restriction endonuclease [Neptunicella sp.]|uniref:type II restriction endonuclease n=1 Tax=Neptunicella sp. TaxID=2125986 RepID=UPI003F68C7AA